MARQDDREPDPRPRDEDPTDDDSAKTRMLTEGAPADEAGIASLETRIVPDAPPTPPGEPGPLAAQAAETVLAADDDRTQIVSGPVHADRPATPAELAQRGETVVAAATDADAFDDVEDGGEAADDSSGPQATRVMDPDDKTAPPAVAAGVAAGAAAARGATPIRRPGPTPIDAERGLAPGTVLFGEYEIVSVLGVGGMGEVYRARHRRLDEHRAIKVMHAELSKKKGASEFFYREAKALLAVRHPAVVHCHDLLSDDEGRVYLIMEMIEGIPLSKKMNDGPLSPDDVAILGARVSHGLAAAHRKGVIHRDVSPDNIVLPNGRVQEAKVIDFGIAKILQQGEGTIVDGFKGKLSYASPEQLGFFGGQIDGRSDFYSLGLVLVAAALGRPMPMGTTVMEAVDARRNLRGLPDEIPVGLRSAIQPLLALDPKDRPRYVDRLFVVPGGVEGTDPSLYVGPGLATRAEPEASKGADRRGLYAGVGVAAAALLGLGLFLASGSERGSGGTEAVAEATTVADVAPPAPEVALPEPVVAPVVAPAEAPAKVAPAAPAPRRVSAQDRIRIIGLLNNARLALGDNRLMAPAGDNAYDRYRKVLDLDPGNDKARAGLREVAARYVQLAEGAIAKGDPAQARDFLDRARRADSSYAGIRETAARLSR
ncbi:MAG: serine/threonine-protein kinase [Myxococcota bacterium]